MTLDRTTYEAWLLDRLEGNLTPEQERQLDAFLAANPDLPAELDALPTLPADEQRIDWKADLHKRFPPSGVPDAARLDDFLVARHEGDLDPVQEQALSRFLYEHPEHAQEARRMAEAHVRPDVVHFPERNALQRHYPPQGLPDRHRLTDFLIAAAENELNPEQRAALNALLRDDPAARREQRLVQAARVEATVVAFPHKELLRKGGGRVVLLWQRLAMAASVALVLGAAWWFLGRDNGAPQQVAQRTVEQAQRPVLPAAVPGQAMSPADTVAAPARTPQRAAVPGSASEGTVRKVEPVQAPLHVNAPRPDESVRPAPAPVPAPLPEPEPLIAQRPETHNDPVAPDATPVVATVVVPKEQRSTVAPDIDASSISALLASSVRRAVGDDAQQEGALDGGDALAAVDRGLHAVTNGQGGLEVRRSDGRDRWKLRLGRGLAISASTGR